MEHLAILGSPSEAWEYFVQYYSVPLTPEKAHLEQEWTNLEMGYGKSPLVFFNGANLIRHKRQQYGVVIPESEPSRHLKRSLSSDFDIQRGM